MNTTDNAKPVESKVVVTKPPEVEEYMSSLSELHKHAATIAEDHLGSSFDIIKSNGFKNWLKSKNTPSAST